MKRLMQLMLAGVIAAFPAQAMTSSAADEHAQTGPAVPPPPAGMGQVVFYRSSHMGMLVSCRVREGDHVVNRLPPGKYFVHVTTPGVHEYNVRSEARDNLRLEVEDGETYYVRCAIGMGRPNISPQTRADFDQRGHGLDLLPPYTGDDGEHHDNTEHH